MAWPTPLCRTIDRGSLSHDLDPAHERLHAGLAAHETANGAGFGGAAASPSSLLPLHSASTCWASCQICSPSSTFSSHSWTLGSHLLRSRNDETSRSWLLERNRALASGSSLPPGR